MSQQRRSVISAVKNLHCIPSGRVTTLDFGCSGTAAFQIDLKHAAADVQASEVEQYRETLFGPDQISS